MFGKITKKQAIPFYNKILDNICFSDYIDRIIFRNKYGYLMK